MNREYTIPWWQRLLATALVWCAYTVFMAWVQVITYSTSSHPMSWAESLLYEALFSIISAALSPAVVLLAMRYPLHRRHLARNIIIHLAGTIAYTAVTRLLWEVCTASLGHQQGPFVLHRIIRSIAWGASDSAPIYWLIVVVHYALDYHRRYQSGLIRTADLNAQLAQAQLQRLKMQLHPHFLFNTLHAISELIHEDPIAAERMIVGLSQLLRLSLDTSSAVEIALHQELEFTELYLDIEKMRFGDRLKVVMDVDPAMLDARVPNLILQPLLENAIKHGISKRPGKGELIVTARKSEEALLISIRDNGVGFETESTYLREGIGLKTTRERLAKLYGTKQSFHFVRRPEAGAEAVIRLPLSSNAVEGVNSLVESIDNR